MAVEGAKAGAGAPEVLGLLERSLQLARDPEAERYAAEMEMILARGGREDPRLRLSKAAAHMESSARLNPYRPSTWLVLERLYRDLGDPARAQALRREGARFCPALRPAP